MDDPVRVMREEFERLGGTVVHEGTAHVVGDKLHIANWHTADGDFWGAIDAACFRLTGHHLRPSPSGSDDK
jgi:hypothetical protein